MWRPARCGSATTSSSLATGPATRPAAFRASQASRLDKVAAHDSRAGRMSDSRWSSQPCGVAKRSSSAHSGRPMARARSGHWCARSTCSMNQPSAARKPCRIPGHGVPIGMPMDQKLGTTSSTATKASSMATSTRCPRPVRSRWRSAAWVPMTANSPVTMSPSPPMGEPTRWLSLRTLELIGAAHGLDDGGQRGPAGVGGVGSPGRHLMPEARDGQIDRRPGARPRRRRSRGRGARWRRRGSSRPRRRSAAPAAARGRARPAA